MLRRKTSHDELTRSFSWNIPKTYNIGTDVVDRHASGNRTALIYETSQGEIVTYTFEDLKRLSNRLANALTGLGLRRGDRVAILLPQSPETAISHVATYKMAAIAVPLFIQFGEEALRYRLADSGARVLITNPANVDKIMAMRDRLPELEHIIVTGRDRPPAGVEGFERLMGWASNDFEALQTGPEDPAMIIYTSGTTGNPKGTLHGHGILLGHLPGVELPHNFLPQEGDRLWTPADWAWIGGILDVLLPALHHGIPVVAHRFEKFDPEQAFQLMARHRVRNTFIPPTALKLMRQVPRPHERFDYCLRSVASGGETLGSELIEWGRETFGLEINEFYGQTECNLIVGNCGQLMSIQPGSMGRAIPGHDVAVIDDSGNVLRHGETGNIAVRRPDPVIFLEYWGKPKETQEKFVGDWLLTGDTGSRDEEGYFWFQGRTDDVITSAGYRIGPAEIEDCLMNHPAVTMVAVVGQPDAVRTEIVKAYIVLADGYGPSDALRSEIQEHVRQRLAAYEYPRVIDFIDEIPMTMTGKIMRRELRARSLPNASES